MGVSVAQIEHVLEQKSHWFNNKQHGPCNDNYEGLTVIYSLVNVERDHEKCFTMWKVIALCVTDVFSLISC